MLVIRDGEWKPCAYFIDGKRVSKEAYNIMEYEIQTHGVADCFLTRRSRNGNWLHSFSGRLMNISTPLKHQKAEPHQQGFRLFIVAMVDSI